MTKFGDAFRVEAVSLDDTVGIFYSTTNPTTGTGFPAPVGSLLLQTDGSTYQKTGTGDFDWESVAAGGTYQLNGVETVSGTSTYAVGSNVVALIDTTSSAIDVNLPDAAGYNTKFFHIKWIDGKPSNKVSINTTVSGQTIDGYETHVMGHIYDSLQLVSNGSNWYIL